MSEKNIIKIITESDFNLNTDDFVATQYQNEVHEFYFENKFKRKTNNNIEYMINGLCKTTDFTTIDTKIKIYLNNDKLSNISPDKEKEAHEKLKKINIYLNKKGYDTTVNKDNNQPLSYEYNIKTKFMEEFQRVIQDFREAYLNYNK
jgi:hypothetical protein